MILYVVHATQGGFAREDAARSIVLGAYIDHGQALRVRLAHGAGAEVTEVQLDFVPPGYQEFVKKVFPR